MIIHNQNRWKSQISPPFALSTRTVFCTLGLKNLGKHFHIICRYFWRKMQLFKQVMYWESSFSKNDILEYNYHSHSLNQLYHIICHYNYCKQIWKCLMIKKPSSNCKIKENIHYVNYQKIKNCNDFICKVISK